MASSANTRPLKEDNPSFVLRGIHDTYYENRPIPQIGPKDVLIEVKATGICGSDVHYLNHARIGDFVLGEPMVLGHESAGIIHSVGEKVTSLQPGDRVALEPGETCMGCSDCKCGKYNLCPDIIFAATPPNTVGTLARYYKLPADLCYLLPEAVSLEDGAMMEPLSVAVHSVSTLGKLKSGQNVIVFGAGPVGLLIMAVAKALGAKKIVAVDINEERLKFAKQYAATDIFVPPPAEKDESRPDYSQRVAGLLSQSAGLEPRGGNAIDLVLEASGAEVCCQIGLHVIKPGGIYVQVGMGAPNVNLPWYLVCGKELTVLGSFRYGPGDYPMAVSLVSRGLVDLKPLVTHRFKFTDALKAFHITQAGKDEDGKAAIKCVIEGPE
ncbi:hypothetical protein QFC24_000769 [Naganishia onofrii]|uniref:Uncharacterized protein n=1 Tax=Naganishia onofrii TaxID=1851511 RepID=A0ACC2XVU7_9TREE|nr:hypothetical protein QFC24_000769 [Naganishia onofrii]